MRTHAIGIAVLVLFGSGTILWADDPEIWAVSATRKVKPDDRVESSNAIFSHSRKLITLRAAKGENEAFHLVITAGSTALEGLDVRVSDLEGSAGVIGKGHITLFREAFFDVPDPSHVWGHPVLGSTGATPDALVPFVDPYGSNIEPGVPFDVPARSSQPVWVSIDVPAEIEGGRYEGTLTLFQRASGDVLEQFQLRLFVWSFALPAKSSIETYYNIEMQVVADFHHGSPNTVDLELMTNYYRQLTTRRISPGYFFPVMPAYDEENGFDWSFDRAGEWWSQWIDELGMSTIGVVPIYNAASAAYLISKPDGSPFVTADFAAGSQFDIRARLFYSRFLGDVTLRGWREKIVVYLDDDQGPLSDEPYAIGAATYDRLRAWADILHRPDDGDPDKELRFLVAGDSVIPSAPYADLRGSCDVWDMYMDEIEDNNDVYRERLTSFPNEELWVVPNAYGDFIDYPAIYARSIAWFAFKYGATGIEQWDVLAWYDSEESLVDPWTRSNLTPVWGWGGGALFWPGTNIENRGINIDGPISSLRLELQRQGFEDYEYLSLLEALGYRDFAAGLVWGVLPSPLYPGIPTSGHAFDRAKRIAGDAIDRGSADLASVRGVVSSSEGFSVGGGIVTNGISAAPIDDDGSYSITVKSGNQVLNVEVEDHKIVASTRNFAPGEQVEGLNFELEPFTRTVTSLFGSFENPADLWEESEGATVSRSTEHVSDGAYSMYVRFFQSHAEPYIATWEIAPGDWSANTTFEFDIYSDSHYLTEVEFVIYNESEVAHYEIFYLRPFEWTHLRMPIKDIRVDTSRVIGFEIYPSVSGRGDRDLYFDNFRLVAITGTDTSAPGAPQELNARWKEDGVELSWRAHDKDAGGGSLTGLAFYEVYSSDTSDGPWQHLTEFHEVVDGFFIDREALQTENRFYIVRAVDQAGNLGPESAPALVTRQGPRRPAGRVR